MPRSSVQTSRAPDFGDDFREDLPPRHRTYGHPPRPIKSKSLPNIPGTAPQWLAGVLGLSGLVVVGWAVFVKDPFGGEPVAVVATEQTAAKPTARDNAKDGKEHARHDGPSSSAPGPLRRALATARIADDYHHRWFERSEAAGQFRQCASGAGALLDTKLLETTRHGSIPKSVRTVRVRRRVTRIRAKVPPNKKDMPSLPSSLAGLASAPLAPQTLSQNFPRR